MNQPTKSQRLLRQSTRCKSQLSENELSGYFLLFFSIFSSEMSLTHFIDVKLLSCSPVNDHYQHLTNFLWDFSFQNESRSSSWKPPISFYQARLSFSLLFHLSFIYTLLTMMMMMMMMFTLAYGCEIWLWNSLFQTEGQIASAVGFSLLVRALILIIGPSPLGLLLFRGMDIAIVDAEREQLFSGTTPPRPLSHLSYDLLMWVPYPLLSAPSATHMSPTLRNRLAFRPRPCLFHLEYLGPPIPCHRMRPFNRTRSDCAIIAVLKSYEIFVHSLG